MNVTFETVICAWDEISKGSVQFIQSRLFIATF